MNFGAWGAIVILEIGWGIPAMRLAKDFRSTVLLSTAAMQPYIKKKSKATKQGALAETREETLAEALFKFFFHADLANKR